MHHYLTVIGQKFRKLSVERTFLLLYCAILLKDLTTPDES